MKHVFVVDLIQANKEVTLSIASIQPKISVLYSLMTPEKLSKTFQKNTLTEFSLFQVEWHFFTYFNLINAVTQNTKLFAIFKWKQFKISFVKIKFLWLCVAVLALA